MRADAVRLFAERAAAVDRDFRLDRPRLAAVTEICQRLDGIPLALELAASQVVTLSPAEIAGLLDERFGLLTGGRRTALERPRTLRATVDWSYSLLSPTEQHVFDRLECSEVAPGTACSNAERTSKGSHRPNIARPPRSAARGRIPRALLATGAFPRCHSCVGSLPSWTKVKARSLVGNPVRASTPSNRRIWAESSRHQSAAQVSISGSSLYTNRRSPESHEDNPKVVPARPRKERSRRSDRSRVHENAHRDADSEGHLAPLNPGDFDDFDGPRRIDARSPPKRESPGSATL
jgi:hypothetical protein